MKIAVLNGSPKGDMSITLRYVKYMEMTHPGHNFDIVNVAAEINRIQKNEDYFSSVILRIADADAILWSFPLYFMLVPAQYKRFIELVFESDAMYAFEGKYAASISTSVHFMDHIAHNYIHAISEDLGMNFYDSYSAHMNDLLNEKERDRLAAFTSFFIGAVDKKPGIQPAFSKTEKNMLEYLPSMPENAIDTGDLSVHILADSGEPGSNLNGMVERLSSSFGGKAKITYIDDIGMKGGCLGCCRCAFENVCVYNDGFCDWYRNELLSSDIIIFASGIHDRFFSSRLKQVFDRSFFLGHTPTMKNKTVGYIVSGNLRGNEILHEFFSAFSDCGRFGFGKAISDECADSAELDDRIDSFAQSLVDYAKSGFIRPPGFYEIGGRKIFRDMIWGWMRPIFRADHRYYKKHKLYDFPQYEYKMRLERTMLGLLLSIPCVKKAALPMMKEHMIEHFDKVLSEIKK